MRAKLVLCCCIAICVAFIKHVLRLFIEHVERSSTREQQTATVHNNLYTPTLKDAYGRMYSPT
jgi:hypothetical protein